DCVMEDAPMLEVLRRASERVFVPLTVGGGIKALTDSTGRSFSAVEVAAEYFRSGADKVSIGSDAVDAAQCSTYAVQHSAATPAARATPSPANSDWVLATTEYGGQFVAAVNRGSVSAVQFHPEKSGATGLDILAGFLMPEEAAAARAAAAEAAVAAGPSAAAAMAAAAEAAGPRGLAKRVIACLDVRSNDQGDLVVTKDASVITRAPL
ncbi:Imidazole glycerol phosphate synthase hisHF, chloroplastic, partial [Tetrabaena socialis]